MNTILIIAATMAALSGAIVIAKFRRAFIVPEGYAGLLYHNGKFVEVLAPGRHVRWGRNYTVDAQDMRKATMPVPTQEISLRTT